jgi:hypothetical protein
MLLDVWIWFIWHLPLSKPNGSYLLVDHLYVSFSAYSQRTQQILVVMLLGMVDLCSITWLAFLLCLLMFEYVRFLAPLHCGQIQWIGGSLSDVGCIFRKHSISSCWGTIYIAQQKLICVAVASYNFESWLGMWFHNIVAVVQSLNFCPHIWTLHGMSSMYQYCSIFSRNQSLFEIFFLFWFNYVSSMSIIQGRGW